MSGQSALFSPERSALPQVAPPANPPTSVTGTSATSQIALSWTAVTGTTSYTICKQTSSISSGCPGAIAGQTGLTFSDTSVTNGTTYYYRVVLLL